MINVLIGLMIASKSWSSFRLGLFDEILDARLEKSEGNALIISPARSRKSSRCQANMPMPKMSVQYAEGLNCRRVFEFLGSASVFCFAALLVFTSIGGGSAANAEVEVPKQYRRTLKTMAGQCCIERIE